MRDKIKDLEKKYDGCAWDIGSINDKLKKQATNMEELECALKYITTKSGALELQNSSLRSMVKTNNDEFKARISKLEMKVFGGVRVSAAGKAVLASIQAENKAKKTQSSTPDTPPSTDARPDQDTQ
jgi:uncharacterized coiled-coil protein SlyX